MRTAFTLMELLVVIGIIAVLFVMGAGVYFATIPVTYATSTKNSMTAIYKDLERHRKAVIDDARKEPIPQTVIALANYDMNRARVIWIKLRLKQQFPTTYAAALNPAPGLIGPEPGYVGIVTRPNAIDPTTESSACLLMALNYKNRRGVNTPADYFRTADTDGDGMLELVDAWGHSIAFFLWPTPPTTDANYPKVVSLAPKTSSFNDVEDPNGTLNAPSWLNSSNGTLFQSICHPVIQPSGQYMTPFLVSPGKNPSGHVWLNADMSAEPAPMTPNAYNIYVP